MLEKRLLDGVLCGIRVIKAALGERCGKGCEGRQEESLGHDWKEQFQ